MFQQVGQAFSLKACFAKGKFASFQISGRRLWSKTRISLKENFFVLLETHKLWGQTDLDLDLISVPHLLYNISRVALLSLIFLICKRMVLITHCWW